MVAGRSLLLAVVAGIPRQECYLTSLYCDVVLNCYGKQLARGNQMSIATKSTIVGTVTNVTLLSIVWVNPCLGLVLGLMIVLILKITKG